jgi:hypothetical protein
MAPVHQQASVLVQMLEHALLEELLIPTVQAPEPVLVAMALLGPAAQKPRA